jgi:hypothetical protein
MATIDDTHSAFTDLCDDAIMTEELTDHWMFLSQFNRKPLEIVQGIRQGIGEIIDEGEPFPFCRMIFDSDKF